MTIVKLVEHRQALVDEADKHRREGKEHEQAAADCYGKVDRLMAEVAGLDFAVQAYASFGNQSQENVAEINSVATINEGRHSPENKRQRRDVRGMVLAALQEAKLGISTESLAEKLDITKAQADAALEHHAGKGNARGNNGMWFPIEPAAVTPIAKPVPSWIQPDGQTTIDLNHGSDFQPGSTPNP